VVAGSAFGSKDGSTESIELAVLSGDNLTVSGLIKVDGSVCGAINS